MKMRSVGIKISLCMILASAGIVHAQELHEKIGVEGKYVREVIEQERINTLPTRQSFTLESSPLTYSLGSVVTGYKPSWSAMPITTPFINRTISKSKGYIDVSMGSWLNSNLSAGYKFVENEKWEAGAWLQHNSTSLFEKKNALNDIKRYRYDEKLGAYMVRKWKGVGVLDAQLAYHFGYFNYYGYSPTIWIGGEYYSRAAGQLWSNDAPNQVLNEATAHVGWRGDKAGEEALKYDVNLDVHYFGFRDFYSPLENFSNYLDRGKGLRETELKLTAGLSKPWKNGSTIGLDLTAEGLFYNGGTSLSYELYDNKLKDFFTFGLQNPDNYGAVTLTPYYRFSRGKLNIRLGADIDLTFNAGNKGERYGAFKAAPDVKLDWRAGTVGVYLNVTGGSELQTLASLHELDYYNMPMLSTTRPVYTPLDAKLGLNFGPYSGFGAGIYAAYKISNHVPLGGWYTTWLEEAFIPESDFNNPADNYQNYVAYSLDTRGINLRGFSAGAHLSYEYGDIVKVEASGTYQPQNGETGYFNGLDRARWTADISARVFPIKKLGINVGYFYRGVRNIYTRSLGPNGEENSILLRYRLPDLTDLRVGASYQITPKIQVYANAINVLGKRRMWLPSLPIEGLNITGGVSIVF